MELIGAILGIFIVGFILFFLWLLSMPSSSSGNRGNIGKRGGTYEIRNSKKTGDDLLENKLTNTGNFEIDFYQKEPNNFYNFGSDNTVLPKKNLQVNFKYKLN